MTTLSSYCVRSTAVRILLLVLVLAMGWPRMGTAQETGAVFVMTNDAVENEIVVFARNAEGQLSQGPVIATSGTVSRYRVRPNGKLKLRGGGHRFGGGSEAFPTDLAITPDGSFLYTLNTGRGTVGMFRVRKSGKLVFLGEVGSLPALAGLQGIAAR